MRSRYGVSFNGTFIAAGASQTLDVKTTGVVILSAIQVRDLVVAEPSDGHAETGIRAEGRSAA